MENIDDDVPEEFRSPEMRYMYLEGKKLAQELGFAGNESVIRRCANAVLAGYWLGREIERKGRQADG